MTRFAQVTRWGATLLAPDRTRFRLWAPDSQRVALEIEGHDPLPMQAAGGGWFETEAPAGAGGQLRQVGGSQLVGAVLEQPREQQIACLQQRQVLFVVDVGGRQQTGGLQVQQGGRHDEELRRLAEVELVACGAEKGDEIVSDL